MSSVFNPRWTFVVPAAACGILALNWIAPNGFVTVLLALGLIGAVIAAVHHAEVIAHRVGEPYGTLVLALSVCIIEVALIVSMMLSGGDNVMALPRDTIFAAVMIILNALIGFSIVVGGKDNSEQLFNVEGMTDALCTMSVIVAVALILPSYTTGAEGGLYSPTQLMFVAGATLVLFTSFTAFQTLLKRNYFVTESPQAAPQDAHALPDNRTVQVSFATLIVSLVAVVLSAKSLSPTMEHFLGQWGAPAAAMGIIIAAIVLLPEFGAAMRAAQGRRLQTSLNLAVGSAIASIGLTIPVVAILAVYMGWPLELGLSLFVTALTLRTGKVTLQPGITLLVLFATYVFFSFAP